MARDPCKDVQVEISSPLFLTLFFWISCTLMNEKSPYRSIKFAIECLKTLELPLCLCRSAWSILKVHRSCLSRMRAPASGDFARHLLERRYLALRCEYRVSFGSGETRGPHAMSCRRVEAERIVMSCASRMTKTSG